MHFATLILSLLWVYMPPLVASTHTQHAAGSSEKNVMRMQLDTDYSNLGSLATSTMDPFAFIKEGLGEDDLPGIDPDLSLQSGGDCFGLHEKMCKPCGGTENILGMCDEVKKECANMFCHPMCTENVLSCEVTFKGEFANASDPLFATALCRQLIAFACFDNKCCEKPEGLDKHSLIVDWVEEAVYGGGGMNPLIPLPFCRFNHLDADAQKFKCAQCKDSVELKIVGLDGSEGCERQYAPAAPGEDPEMWEEEPVDPAPKEDEGQHSALARCVALRTKISAKAGSLMGAQKVCECAGCCEPPKDDSSCILPTHWLQYPEKK